MVIQLYVHLLGTSHDAKVFDKNVVFAISLSLSLSFCFVMFDCGCGNFLDGTYTVKLDWFE